MKNKVASRSAFFQPRVLFSFALVACALSGLLVLATRAQETPTLRSGVVTMQLEEQEQEGTTPAEELAPEGATPGNDTCATAISNSLQLSRSTAGTTVGTANDYQLAA